MDRRRYLVRAGAVALDLMMCMVGVLLVGFVLGVFAGPKAATIGGIVVALAYSLVEAFRAQSFGKHFLDLKVGMLDGSAVSRRVLVQRWATKHAPTIFGTLAIVTGM